LQTKARTLSGKLVKCSIIGLSAHIWLYFFATGRLARSRDRSIIFNDKNVRLWAGKSQTGICNVRQHLSERLGLSRWDICEIGHVK